MTTPLRSAEEWADFDFPHLIYIGRKGRTDFIRLIQSNAAAAQREADARVCLPINCVNDDHSISGLCAADIRRAPLVTEAKS